MALAMPVPKPPQPPAPPQSQPEPEDSGWSPRRWTRAEYYRAAELGIFDPDERLELIEGEIIRKMSQDPPHATALTKSIRKLTAAFPSDCFLRSQQPVNLGERSDPEPDVCVVKGEPDDYDADHPTAADALLILEVSDTTLRLDRIRKAKLYAQAGVPDYWLLNINERTLEVRRDPQPDESDEIAYRTTLILMEQEEITPLAAPQSPIRIADLLPSAPKTA